MPGWTASDIPDQSGRTVLVTGGNSGLGYQTVLQLARKGAHVLLAARDRSRGQAALKRLAAEAPGSRTDLAELDLADLASVERFSTGFLAGGQDLDVLVNNAGVMAIPHRETTAQGYERQFGTNHLGHFALTGRLLPALIKRPGSRVVTVSSNQHKRTKGINFDDLQGEHSYQPWPAYAQSKLANAMFVLELDRRLRAAGLDVISVGAHPGFAATNLQISGPRSGGTGLVAHAMGFGTRLLGQPASYGALPQLYAATAEDVHGGEYFGPDGPGEMRGHHPKLVQFSAAARDEAAAARLWAVSEKLTGVTFEALTAK
jgi:NAD(P)-dependent dehydrogenase (short-subunit alcohol dehydrogenase family)